MCKKILTTLILILFLFTPSLLNANEITICDIVSETSDAGAQLSQILDDNGYSYTYCDSLSDNTGELLILIAGIQEYGQGDYLEEAQLQKIRNHLNAGKDALIFGSANLQQLPLSMIGVDILTLDPLPADSLWGTESNFLGDMNFIYPEEDFAPQGSYYIVNPDFDPEMEALHSNWGSSPMCKGVLYQNSSPQFDVLTLNIDPSMIDNHSGYDTFEDLILKSLQDYYHIYTDVDGKSPGLPDEPALNQNFPNPFNNSTVIEYELSNGCDVNLSIYDLLGRRLAVLIDSYQVGGKHSAVFDAEGISSGVYYYVLKTDDKKLVRRMSLIK